ncbi:hypothetical protein NPJ88_000255 [Halomonas elongata]|uniref:hypothetical protein n=1 Tax=Halomonas elongata TaxID=2746 RepID=UPI00255B202E|nr:hypothetical protein [Halomonas elongata]MDL4860754.1 hypothetical protein [Halomonas elongata]
MNMLETMAANASDHEDWKAVYAKRDEVVQAMVKIGSIKASDLPELDRLGRFTVAKDHWGICDQPVRQALLIDHPHVQSAARQSQRKVGN